VAKAVDVWADVSPSFGAAIAVPWQTMAVQCVQVFVEVSFCDSPNIASGGQIFARFMSWV